MGTQVGTPAWVPDSADTDVDVAKNWFVIIKGSKTRRATERDHVQMDTAGTNTVVATRGQPLSARSSHPTVSLGGAGERALALSAHVCSARQQASCLGAYAQEPHRASSSQYVTDNFLRMEVVIKLLSDCNACT